MIGTAGFQQWLQRVATLSGRQREQLLAVLRPAVDLDRACATIERARPALSCPDCGGRRLHRGGVQRGLQRYRCCACGRTFNALTGTPLARLRHHERWLPGLDGMLDGKSVRATAEALGVHRNTAFRWRHRFLHLAKHDRPQARTGIAEADELFLLESQKGSRKLDRPPRKRGHLPNNCIGLQSELPTPNGDSAKSCGWHGPARQSRPDMRLIRETANGRHLFPLALWQQAM